MGSLELALGAWRGGSRGERGRLGLAWGWLDRFPHPFRWRPVLYKRLPPGELSARRPISWSAWVRRIWSPGGRDPPRSAWRIPSGTGCARWRMQSEMNSRVGREAFSNHPGGRTALCPTQHRADLL